MGKVAQVRTRKRGKTFSYIFEAGKTADGKRKVVEKGGFPTKEAAYKAGVAAYYDWLHGNIGLTSEKVTLGEFFESWLVKVVAPNVKPTTLLNYRAFSEKRILPYLSKFKVQEITPAMLDNWIHELQRIGLAYKSIATIHSVLHSALDYAVYPAQLIQANPASYIKVPKNAPHRVVERTIITPEQFAALLKKYPFGSKLYIPLILLYHTGMRIGEVLGLRWRDVDFNAAKITLRQQVVYLRRRGEYLAPLKTETSNRYFFIHDSLANELKRWRNQQAENEMNFDGTYVYVYGESDGHLVLQSKFKPLPALERIDLVCVQPSGLLCSRDSIMRALRKEGLNSHSFRHTHATRLIESGASPNAVAGRLGHKDATITQNLYTHNTEKMQQDLVPLVADFVQTKP